MKKEFIVKKLFHTYTIWFVGCMIIMILVALWYFVTQINETIVLTQEQMKTNISANIKSYMDDMNDFSRALVNSTDFSKGILVELPHCYKEGKQTTTLFSNLYLKANKMIQKKYNVGVATDSGYYIWMGENYYIGAIQKETPNLYQDYVRDGRPFIKRVKQNEYLLNTWIYDKGMKNTEMIVLARNISALNVLGKGEGILEIQMSAADFDRQIDALLGENAKNPLIISVYGSDDTLFYGKGDIPYEEIQGLMPGKKAIYGNSIIMLDRIPQLGIRIVYRISISKYYDHLSRFLFCAVAFSIVMGSIIVMVNYRISNELSSPIKKICTDLEKIDLKNESTYQKEEFDIWEIDYLSLSISELTNKLQESLRSIIVLKDFETHSKLLALQAQMQPHFLFNTLTMIGSLAEESGNDDIAEICQNLTGMFRYIASEESGGVVLYEEMLHIEHYVKIMKKRFPNAQINIDIPLEILQVKLPKLSIQPLVENSFKYCNRNHPCIKVEGVISQTEWYIIVYDNGNGFSKEKADEIMKKCKNSALGVQSLSAQIDGIGLVNVYVRLKLFLKDAFIFEIKPFKDGYVKIGGVLPKEEDEKKVMTG
ncbi:sensor histidine kinase [Lachnoclostridium sp.]|uniref:sensor histidine kinase n=1 Tax=Lachnoclostridium sp. TaxID=2028282 RepID=UPI0028A1CAA7|nr:histidine kinase [Lachnoclostridium sp.]